MWTYSGLFLEVKDGKSTVYANDPYEIDFVFDIKEDGFYQLIIGYGRCQGPKIYRILKLADELHWDITPNDLDEPIKDLMRSVSEKNK